MSRTPSASAASRRSVLAAGAGALGCSLSLSGCLGRAQRVVDRDADDHLSLSIVTVPADDDRAGVQIARHLESNLEAVGIDVTVAMRSHSEFLETVLLDAEFDLYVGRHPAGIDPDFLYETLHSTYASEAGWQNPFGFTNLAFDRLLEAQRTADGERRERAVASVLRSLARETPFEPICFPEEHRIARTDRAAGWSADRLPTRRGYLGLEPVGDEPTVAAGSESEPEDEDEDGRDDEPSAEPTAPVAELDALVTDARPTQNLNPLSATVRERGAILELCYDSLGVVDDGELRPRLAESWVWDGDDAGLEDGADGESAEIAVDGDSESGESDETAGSDDRDDAAEPADSDDSGDRNGTAERTHPDDSTESVDSTETTVTVTLRENCRFHDGEPLTAADVAFTYRFLADTALGRASVPSPPPRYAGHASAVEAVRVDDENRVTLSLAAGRDAARRAFTVPILPEHVWRERVEDHVDPAGDATAPQGRWHAVTTDNVPPIGSGPFRFAARAEREHVTLERFADHFTLREDVDLPAPTVETLRFEVDPGSASAIERVRSGDADVTASMLEPRTVADLPDVDGRDDSGEVEGERTPDDDAGRPPIRHLEAPSRTFYHVGFNARDAPLSNAHFRRAVARLIDESWLVEEVFHGHARPTAAPVGDEWLPPDLEWDGADPATPFFGIDGTLDVEAARTAFEALGFRYDGGRLRR